MDLSTSELIKILLLLISIGGVSGFLSGLLGVGGGILFVPALYSAMTALGYESSYAMHIALGSSLAIVFAVGSTSALQHYRRGAVDMDILRLWGPYIVGGVLGGSLLAGFMHGLDLKAIFAVMTMLIALHMMLEPKTPQPESERKTIPVKAQRGIAGIIGAIASMIGVGGAIMTIPFMSYMGTPIQRAIGTGAALGVVISVPGTIGYMITGSFSGDDLPPYSIGYVNFLAVGIIAPLSMLMAPLGVSASHSLPKTLLRRIFSVMIMIVSVRMFLSIRNGG